MHARTANRAVFSFQDKQRAYTRNPVRVDDDAGAVDSERSVQQVDLTTVVDYATAEKCAQRKSLQLLAPPTQQRLMMAYTARSLYAGQAFTLDGRPMRVSSITPSAFSPLVEVVAVDDKYSADDTGFGTGDTGQGGSSGSVAADVIVALVEAPYSAVGAETRLLVLRVRGSEASAAATVWVSSNGSSYASIGTQPTWCFGGTVTVDHEASIRTVDEEGPIVAAVGYGTDVLQDLTGDDDSWRTGRQAALVVETGEIMYVRKTTSLGGGSYRLDDCVRGRAGTQKADVPAGSTIVIFDTSAATTFADRLIAPGTAVWIKSQPRGVELSDVAPAYAEIEGWALAPLPALLHRDGAFYDSSGDAVIEWGYAVRDGDGDAASERPAGAAISDTPAHEGEFLVEIVDPSDDSVVRTGTVDSDSPSYTYTSAQRTADFGAADPTFIVRVTNVLGSRSSPSREMTVQAY